MIAYNEPEKDGKVKVIIVDNQAGSWFAGMSRVLRSLMNKQVKGDRVGSCRGLIGPKIKYTRSEKRVQISHVFQVTVNKTVL